MASVRHFEFEKIELFCQTAILGMEIKLFSKWRFSAILNLRKLPLWLSDRYLPVILHLHSENLHKFANMALRYCQKRFSIWRPSAILNLKNFNFLSNFHARNGNFYLCTNVFRNRLIHGWDMEITLFSKWRPSAILNLRNCSFGHVTYIGMWSFISVRNFALIGQYGAEI